MKWDSAIPDGIRPSAGNLQTVSINRLLRDYGVRGQRRMRQFGIGFQIMGSVSQLDAYPSDGGNVAFLHRSNLFATVSARFRERSEKSGYSNSKQMWVEAGAHVAKGCLSPPVPSGSSGIPEG